MQCSEKKSIVATVEKREIARKWKGCFLKTPKRLNNDVFDWCIDHMEDSLITLVPVSLYMYCSRILIGARF